MSAELSIVNCREGEKKEEEEKKTMRTHRSDETKNEVSCPEINRSASFFRCSARYLERGAERKGKKEKERVKRNGRRGEGDRNWINGRIERFRPSKPTKLAAKRKRKKLVGENVNFKGRSIVQKRTKLE